MDGLARFLRRAAAAGALLGACGCTLIGHERVSDWPRLEVLEHYVPHAEMRSRCGQYAGFGMSPEACAEFDLARGRCDIWYSADFPPPPPVIAHERLHCAGYDHIGESSLRAMLARYRAAERLAGLAGASAGATSP
jgi:hypothetical protein